MLAKLKADLAAVRADAAKAKAYVVEHYKQLVVAVLAGHLGLVSVVVAAVRHVLGL